MLGWDLNESWRQGSACEQGLEGPSRSRTGTCGTRGEIGKRTGAECGAAAGWALEGRMLGMAVTFTWMRSAREDGAWYSAAAGNLGRVTE